MMLIVLLLWTLGLAILYFFKNILAAVILICLASGLLGWAHAHYTVATECERLGKFFVGKKVYQCVKVEQVGDDGK